MLKFESGSVEVIERFLFTLGMVSIRRIYIEQRKENG